MDAAARIVAVCAVHALVPGPKRGVPHTSIDKRPRTGRVAVGVLGVEGDSQQDVAHHGGPDQAVYAYAEEEAAWWASELGRPVAPGSFGENLRTSGLDVDAAVAGERWQVGAGPDAVLLEVTSPRTPCITFAAWTGEPHWLRRFAARGRPGIYLRVLRPGTVAAGDPVGVVHRPHPGVRVVGAPPVAGPGA